MALKLPRVLAEMNPKKRQYVYFGLAVAGALLIYLGINQMLVGSKPVDSDGPVATATKANTKILTHRPGQQISDRENWIGGAARDLETLKKDAVEKDRKQDAFNRELLSRLEQIEKNKSRAALPTEPPPPPAPYRRRSCRRRKPIRRGRGPILPVCRTEPIRSAAAPESQAGAGPVSVGMLRVTLRPEEATRSPARPDREPRPARTRRTRARKFPASARRCRCRLCERRCSRALTRRPARQRKSIRCRC